MEYNDTNDCSACGVPDRGHDATVDVQPASGQHPQALRLISLSRNGPRTEILRCYKDYLLVAGPKCQRQRPAGKTRNLSWQKMMV